MLCPYCNHQNIDGADACESCLNDLTGFEVPGPDSALGSSIVLDSLATLKPRAPLFISPDAPVREAISKLCQHRVGCLLVQASDKVVGIFSERDVILRIATDYDDVAEHPVSEFMTPNPVKLDVGASIAFCLNRMALGEFRHLPVTDRGRVVGIISIKDILNYLNTQFPEAIRA